MSATAWLPGELGRDVDGTPITMGARVEQAKVDTELGALRSRLGLLGPLLLLSSTVRRIHTVHRAQVLIAPAAPAPNARCSWDAA